MNIENHKVITKETKRRKHTKRRYRAKNKRDRQKALKDKNINNSLNKYI